MSLIRTSLRFASTADDVLAGVRPLDLADQGER